MLNIGTNAKLGKRVASWSRTVGPTCPSDCPFLTGRMPDGSAVAKSERCYAESLQKRYTSVRTNWAKNADQVWAQWEGAFVAEVTRTHHRYDAIRIHVGGDWVENNRVDRPYLAAVLRGLRKLRREGIMTPMWYYTHCARLITPHKKYFEQLGVQGFASVHDASQAKEYAALGWRLAIDPGENKKHAKPGFHEIHGVKSLQCPEQLDKVKCDACGYCFKAGGNRMHVTFGRH